MKKALPFSTLILSLMFCAAAHAQETQKTIYMDQMLKMTANTNAPFKLELKKIAGDTFGGIVFDYLGSVKSQGTYIKVSKSYLEDGYFTYYYQNGQIESEGEFDRGVKVGTWKRFDSNGKRKTDKYYPAESADKIRETMMMEKEE